jgi:micrococcal nuclease
MSRKKRLGILMAAVFACLSIYRGLAMQQQSSANQAPTVLGEYRVSKVVDGDTVEVSIDGRTQKVRLIGMDTPEVVDPRKAVQCFGREASAEAKRRLSGKTVRLEYDVQVGEQDKYGRRLAYVFLPDGTNYAEGMIRDGYAKEYTYQGQVYKYQENFNQAEEEAEQAARGLWSPTTCDGDTKQPAK